MIVAIAFNMAATVRRREFAEMNPRKNEGAIMPGTDSPDQQSTAGVCLDDSLSLASLSFGPFPHPRLSTITRKNSAMHASTLRIRTVSLRLAVSESALPVWIERGLNPL